MSTLFKKRQEEAEAVINVAITRLQVEESSKRSHRAGQARDV